MLSTVPGYYQLVPGWATPGNPDTPGIPGYPDIRLSGYPYLDRVAGYPYFSRSADFHVLELVLLSTGTGTRGTSHETHEMQSEYPDTFLEKICRRSYDDDEMASPSSEPDRGHLQAARAGPSPARCCTSLLSAALSVAFTHN